jgi:hypothetical protein
MCRVYAILMVGNIEAMLERWLDRDHLDILTVYFAKKSSNEDRVNNLRSAFILNGINVKKEVFDDYLAIKYIRNAIVHASWTSQSKSLKQEQIDWIVGRGFPSDTRRLDLTHWQRIEWVNQNMMLYIALTGLTHIQLKPDLNEIEVESPQLLDTSGIIGQSDWPRVYWSNLERISSVISTNIRAAAESGEVNLSCGLTSTQLKDMTPYEKERRFYLSAYDAAKQGCAAFKDVNGYADNVVMCWNQFVANVPEFRVLRIADVRAALDNIRIMHKKNIHPRDHIFPSLREDAPLIFQERLVSECFDNIEPLTTRNIAEAYALGKKAKYAIMNITPLFLFSIMLPIYSPERSREWNEKAQYIADVFELGQLWYASIEGHVPSNQNIDLCRDLSKKFAESSQKGKT